MKEEIKMDNENKNTLSVILGANIMARRKEKNMTQAEFADFLEIEQHSLSRMEKGQIAPKLSRLQQIADGLDCTVADLFKSSISSHNADAKAKALAITEILSDLDPELQDVVLELVQNTVSVLIKKK